MSDLTELDEAFAEVEQRRAAAASHEQASRGLWLAHHWPHRYERCTVIGGRHVCRRCLWFYVTAFLTLAAAPFGVSPWPASWDLTMVWLLALPATIDFVGGEFGWWRYDARRQIVVTFILGLAVGRGFYAELLDSGSWTFWGPVLVYGSLWFAVAVLQWTRKRGQYREDHEHHDHHHGA